MAKKKSSSHANRGMGLESKIDKVNEQYKYYGIADVRKIPTPIKITKHRGGMITGFTMKGEWVDYVGVTFGTIIVFDAKETSLKNLPLANIHDHQYELLESWYQYGADSFLVVYFKEENKYFKLPFVELEKAWNRMLNGGRKSIPLKEFYEYAEEIPMVKGYLDYLYKFDSEE